MYLTYEEYVSYGGTLDETSFNNYEFQARTKVDWYTFNRLQNETEYPEAVKRCVYNIISYLVLSAQVSGAPEAQEGALTAGVTSQSNDGVSISYNVLSAQQIVDKVDENVKNVIYQYLQGITNSLGQKVLYRGVYPNE